MGGEDLLMPFEVIEVLQLSTSFCCHEPPGICRIYPICIDINVMI